MRELQRYIRKRQAAFRKGSDLLKRRGRAARAAVAHCKLLVRSVKASLREVGPHVFGTLPK